MKTSQMRSADSQNPLLAEWAGHPAGRVFRGDPDLIGKLEGVRYREATDFERRVGGFVD